jgi:DNA-binding CsgD family transcriptional regulator/tetratricopeptide (TPR) repeat protein
VVLDDQGNHAAALPWHREAMAIFERHNDRLNQAKQWHNLSVLYGRTMLFAEALQALRRSADLQKDIPDPKRFREFMTWTDQAELCVEMGDYETAEQAALRGVDTTSAEGPIFGRGEPHAVLGTARLALVRVDEAEQAFVEARRRFEKLGHRVGVAHALHGLARIAAARGDRNRACKLENTAITVARECGAKSDSAKFLCQLGRFTLEQGDADAALLHGREALQCSAATTGIIPSELDARRLIADAFAAKGDAAEAFMAHREFHERFAAANDARKTMQSRVLAVQYQLDLAQRDAAHARLENAKLSEALAEVAARLEAERSGKPTAVPKEVTPESLRPLGLSRRESEVLLWVARGKTNDEIAMILGCGAETVKSHLKRIYQQLDVTNRAAASARAVEFSGGGMVYRVS